MAISTLSPLKSMKSLPGLSFFIVAPTMGCVIVVMMMLHAAGDRQSSWIGAT